MAGYGAVWNHNNLVIVNGQLVVILYEVRCSI